MATNTITPNMSLVVPTVGSEAGPQYATDINGDLTILDSHNHSSGSGVQITPSGLNINSSLPINDNFLTSVGAVNLQAQASPPSLNASVYCLGVDLYYIDGSGNVVRITQSGNLAGTPGSISGLVPPASAAYSGGTFVFQSAALTAANLDAASVILRNTTASSFGLTLSPPLSLGGNYTITLPSIPAQTNVMTLDTSGNMGSITYDQVGEDMTSVGANAIANTRTRVNQGSSAVVGNIATTGSSGTFATSSTSPVGIPGLALTLATSGRPVMVILQAAVGSTAELTTSSGGGLIKLDNIGTSATTEYEFNQLGSSISWVDYSVAGSPGSYEYIAQLGNVLGGSATTTISGYILLAYEL